MRQSVTNKLIANVKQSQLDDNNNFINSENVICIDSSFNRIGINTRNPQYSIDICGNDLTLGHGINSNYINVDNSAIINEVSCNLLNNDALFSNNIDVSSLIFEIISGNILNGNYLNINEISVNDLSTNNISVLNELSANTIKSNSLISGDISVNGILRTSFVQLANNITPRSIDTSLGSIDILTFSSAVGTSAEIIDLSLTNLDVSGIARIINLDVSNLTISDSPINTIISSQISDTLIDNPVNINANDITCNTINVTSNDETSIETSGGIIVNGASVFHQGVTFNNNVIIDGRCQPVTLVLPIGLSTSTSDNSIYSSSSSNSLMLRKNAGTTIEFKPLKNDFVVLELSGNDSYSNSNILTVNNINYKKFNIRIKDTNCDISLDNNVVAVNSSNFINTTNNTSNILKINANISLQLNNVVANDIELSNYNFGIYEYYTTTSTTDICINDFTSSLVNITNSIMVFDNSFNYSNTSLSYIYKTSTTINDFFRGISFLIKETNDCCLNNLLVSSFNATVNEN